MTTPSKIWGREIRSDTQIAWKNHREGDNTKL